ncbi:MarR family winged helix-turn-helix transcriptional regulator [Acinetobacter sp.]|jgi:DNA-binding MarR family transcriptional regulator|uniref:MarR family winged helix-turn-helix transcriptional regulator n=1 Tax=Acinetobacter sp. TaxID=472 RepID=UPI0035AE65C1
MNSQLGFRASLMRCARMFSDEVNTILLPYQLNYSLWQVMFVIQEKQGCTSIEIAEYLNVSKPSIAKRTRILAQLNVVSQVQTDDKRQKKLVLSAAGQKLYQQCAAEIGQFEQQLIQPFNPQEILKSTALLNEISAALETRTAGKKQ